MSDNHESVARRLLKERMAAHTLGSETHLHTVLSEPRSDIGKGTVTAVLMALTPDRNAIKFDGLLNTNRNGRHTAIGHDDFGIYEQANPDLRFGRTNYLLGGELLLDFIRGYGEFENLSYRPHMVWALMATLGERHPLLGSPRNLFFEIGGTIQDPEVDTYVTPALQAYRQELGSRSHLILLTELAVNGNEIKTRAVQRNLERLTERSLPPDILMVRMPKGHTYSTQELQDAEGKIDEKLVERCVVPSASTTICVPHFDTDVLPSLKEYLKERFAEKRVLPYCQTLPK